MQHTRKSEEKLRAMGYKTIARGAQVCGEAGLTVYYRGKAGEMPGQLWAPVWAADLLQHLDSFFWPTNPTKRAKGRALAVALVRRCSLEPSVRQQLRVVQALGDARALSVWVESMLQEGHVP